MRTRIVWLLPLLIIQACSGHDTTHSNTVTVVDLMGLPVAGALVQFNYPSAPDNPIVMSDSAGIARNNKPHTTYVTVQKSGYRDAIWDRPNDVKDGWSVTITLARK